MHSALLSLSLNEQPGRIGAEVSNGRLTRIRLRANALFAGRPHVLPAVQTYQYSKTLWVGDNLVI